MEIALPKQFGRAISVDARCREGDLLLRGVLLGGKGDDLVDDGIKRAFDVVLLNLAGVDQLGEAGVKGQGGAGGNAVVLGDLGALGLAEDEVLLAAFVALEVGHVLDQTKHRDVHLVRQVDGLANDHGDQLLRGGNRDDAVKVHALHDGQEHVGGSRRHVNQQVVDLFPVGVAEELLQKAGDNRAAPGDRCVFLIEHEIGGNGLDAAFGFEGQDAVFVAHQAALKAECLGDGRAGDISVKDAHLVAALGQLGGKQAGDQRLANAALAGNDADDVLHVGACRGGALLLGARSAARAAAAAAAAVT